MSEDAQTPRVSVDFETDVLYVDSQIGLRVRKTPEVGDNKIETLPFGKEVRVIEKKDDWFSMTSQLKFQKRTGLGKAHTTRVYSQRNSWLIQNGK